MYTLSISIQLLYVCKAVRHCNCQEESYDARALVARTAGTVPPAKVQVTNGLPCRGSEGRVLPLDSRCTRHFLAFVLLWYGAQCS